MIHGQVRQIGRYQIECEIGRGGMGIVYRALDPVLRRVVAVKVIRLSEFAEPEQRAELEKRLVREARSAGVLAHSNIVAVYDLVQEEDLTSVVMEFVEGRTLAAIMAEGRVLENAAVLSILWQAGEGLDCAHSKGIVHRDVKPSNLIVQPDGVTKIADFGVARVSSTLALTKSSMVMGTPHYMSPEQVQGKPVDGRADQFSLAVTAYEILTGRKPFAADTMATLMYKIVHEDPLPANSLNATLGPQVGAVVQKALSKEAGARYNKCGEFVDALERACKATKGWRALPVTGQAEEEVPPVTSASAAPGRWVLAAGGGVLLVVLAAGGYFTFLRPVEMKEEPARIEQPAAPLPAAEIPAPAKEPNPPENPRSAPETAPAPARKLPAQPPKEATGKPQLAVPPKEAAGRPQPAVPPKEAAGRPQPAVPPKEAAGNPQPAVPPKEAAGAKAPETAPAPSIAYSGPPTGSLVWTGELEANGKLAINGKLSSTGSVSSELPGVPVRIQLWPSSARLIEMPGPENRYKRVVVTSGERKQLRIIIRWEVVR
jgi:serine/threonine-protein kinase